MFNREGFNQTRFNTVDYIVVDMSALLSGNTSVAAQANMEMKMSANLSGSTSVIADFIREIQLTLEMSGQTEVSAEAIRERTFSAEMISGTSLTATAGKFHIDVIEFTGQFKPGDRIVIDSKNLTFTLNGQNALHMMHGDFFDLILGKNKLTYEDTETGREVLIRVTHRDKYV